MWIYSIKGLEFCQKCQMSILIWLKITGRMIFEHFLGIKEFSGKKIL